MGFNYGRMTCPGSQKELSIHPVTPQMIMIVAILVSSEVVTSRKLQAKVVVSTPLPQLLRRAVRVVLLPVKQLSKCLCQKVCLDHSLTQKYHQLKLSVAVRLLVPRSDERQSIRPFDVIASDLDVLLELKPEGKVRRFSLPDMYNTH